MRLFIDTDVLLDVYLNRKPFASSSGALLDWAERNPGSASVSWHGLANLHYLSRDGALEFIRDLVDFCEVPATGTVDLLQALDLGFSDLEDAMQTAAALKFGAQVIATRNGKDFRQSPIAVETPKNLMTRLG